VLAGLASAVTSSAEHCATNRAIDDLRPFLEPLRSGRLRCPLVGWEQWGAQGGAVGSTPWPQNRSQRSPTAFNGPSLTCRWHVSEGQRGVSGLIHTEEVTGSIPVSPTDKRPGQRLFRELPTRPFDLSRPDEASDRHYAGVRSHPGRPGRHRREPAGCASGRRCAGCRCPASSPTGKSATTRVMVPHQDCVLAGQAGLQQGLVPMSPPSTASPPRRRASPWGSDRCPR